MTRLPGIGAATRFGVSRTVGLTTALARAALPEGSHREAFRTRATDALSEAWDVTLDGLLRAGLIERTADRLLAEEVAEQVFVVVVEHPATDRLITRVIESPDFEVLLTRVVESPGFERLVTRIFESPGFERLVLSIVHSERFDHLLDRVLASEQLDRVVTQIAESEEVQDALWQQTHGVTDHVTDELRERTIAADALLERLARAVIRRRPPSPGQAGSGTP